MPQKRIMERMEKLGYDARKLDECGNAAFIRDFKDGYILVSEYFAGIEIYQVPSKDWLQRIIVQVHDKNGDVVYSHLTDLLDLVEHLEEEATS